MLRLVLLFCATALNAAQPWSVDDLWTWREVTDVRIRPDGSSAAWVEASSIRGTNNTCTTLWLASIPTAKPQRLDGDACNQSHPRWSPDGRSLAYLAGGQIWIRAFAGERPRQITHAASPPLAFAWSPDATALAYTAHTFLYVVPLSGGAPVPVPTGKLNVLGEPAWMPDGKSILISAAEPGGDAEIYSVALDSGSAHQITHHAGPDFDPLPAPDGSRIAWISRDARAQSYVTAKLNVANPDGSRGKILAGALDRDVTHIQWSSDSRTVYFLAEDRGESRVWSARADGSVRQATTAGERLVDFSLADNGLAAAVRPSGEILTFPVDVPGAPALLASPNAPLLAARNTSAPEEIHFPSAGRAIQGWITRPPGFDRARRYPLVLDVRDAPRRMCGLGFDLRAQILAARGFVVLCANPRGTPGFGEEFGNLLRTRDPGDDFDDLMRGADYLIAQGFIDPARMHIIGGPLAAWAIGQTDRFRSAVAVDPPAVNGTDPERLHTPTLVIDTGTGKGAYDMYSALRARRIDTELLRVWGPQQLEAILSWLAR